MSVVLSSPAPDRSARNAIAMAVYAMVLLALTAGVLMFARVAAPGAALIWPANAVAVAMITRYPTSRWPAWMAVTGTALLLANLLLHVPIAMATGFAVINLIEIGIVAGLIRHTGADPRGLRGYAAVVVIAVVGAAISTPLGTAMLWLATGASPVETALRWFATSAMGMVILLPPLKATRRDVSRPWSGMSPGLLLLPLPTVLVALCVFGTGSSYPLLFLLMPCGVFAAFRYRFVGAAITTLTVAIVATVFTMQGTGPIAAAFPAMVDRVLFLQAFLSAITLTAFPVATLLYERLQVLSEIRGAERQLRLLTDHSTDLILRIGPDGIPRYASPAAQRVLGYPPGRLVGRNSFALIHPDDRDRVRAAVEMLVRDGGEYVLRYRQRHRDGHHVWLEGAFRRVREGDAPPELIATVRDIGQRQAAEQAATMANALLEERQRMLTMAEAVAQIGHWRLNVADATVFWSPEVYRIHGVSPDSEPSLAVAIDCYHPDDRPMVRDHVDRALVGGGTFRFEARIVRPDGTLRWITSRGQAERMPGGAIVGLFGVFHDITEQVEAMAELRTAREAAERALEAKAVFTATMSHEIRTPLTSILAAAQLLRETPDRTERMRHLDTLEQAGRILSAIVDDVLTFSKLEAVREQMETIDFDPQELATTVAGMFAADAAAHHVTLETDAASGRVSGDPMRLRRVLTNLVGNAIKFTRDGTVRIAVRRDDGDMWRFKVVDTGVGIRSDRLDAIFEPFVQADVSTTRSYGGTGLGLSISRMLVESMGGTIGVDSRPGAGSCFWFAVPLPPAAPVVADPVAAGDPSPDGVALNVLVAEDNDTNRYLIAEIVRRSGHRVIAVENGARAVEYVTGPAGHPVDVVLMDIQMPVMDGLAATRAIRAWGGSGATVPIHALTADLSGDRRRSIAAAGMDGVLAKPVDVAALGAVLATVRAVAARGTAPAIDPVRVRALGETLGIAARNRLLSLLIEDARRIPARLRELVTARRIDLARREAHGLRGAAATVGADGLMTVLHAIEVGDDAVAIDPARLDELDRRAQAVVAAARSVID